MISQTSTDPREKTRAHNENILFNNGFKRIGNSSLYTNRRTAILSPAVSKGSQDLYWFDIRKVNVEKMNQFQQSYFLLRIVPNLFVFMEFIILHKYLTKETMDNRPHSGDVWGFTSKLDLENSIINIESQKDKFINFNCKVISFDGIQTEIRSLFFGS